MALLQELRRLVNERIANGEVGEQTKIARDSGIHRVTLRAFLRGDRGLSVEAAEKLAEALGMELRLAKR